MRIQLVSILSVITLLLSSCEKDPPIPAPPAVLKVKEIRNSPIDFQQFSYDNAGRLTNYVTQFTSGPGNQTSSYSINLQYNGDLIAKAIMPNGYYNYVYANGKLQQINAFTNAGKKLSTTFFTLNAAGKLTEMRELIEDPASGNPIETKHLYTYNANGNVISIESYIRDAAGAPFVFIDQTVYENYDNKNINPVEGRGDFYLPGITLMVNNPGRIIHKTANGTVIRIDRFEYQYNNAGYPVQKIWHVEATPNPVSPITFTYQYW